MTDHRFTRVPKNGCSACRQDFASMRLFDAHRVGKHEFDWSFETPSGRRCLEAEEMEALGWVLDDRDRWSDPVRAEKTRKAFSRMSPGSRKAAR